MVAISSVLVKGGSVGRCVRPGTHTLDTKNIPILNKIINLPFGGKSPFKAEVWYINKDITWILRGNANTDSDPGSKVWNIYSDTPEWSIWNSCRSGEVLTKLVTTMNVFDAETVTKYFRSLYVTKIKDTISSYLLHRKISILEMNAYIDEISQYMKRQSVR